MEIVSTAGYVIAEYVFLIIGTYLLVGMLLLTRVVVAVMQNKSVKKSVGISVAIGCGIYGVYLFDVRIGFVMLVNGLLLMRIVMDALIIRKYFVEMRKYFIE